MRILSFIISLGTFFLGIGITETYYSVKSVKHSSDKIIHYALQKNEHTTQTSTLPNGSWVLDTWQDKDSTRIYRNVLVEKDGTITQREVVEQFTPCATDTIAIDSIDIRDEQWKGFKKNI